MPLIGRRQKRFKLNPPHVMRKRRYQDENLATATSATTPQPKRSRYGSTATPTAISPIEDSNSNTNQMKNLLHSMSEEVGPKFTSSFILSNIASILKLAFDDVEEAIATLVNDHLGLVYAPATGIAVTPGGNAAQQSTKSAMAPAPIAQETVVSVSYKPKILKLSPLNPNLPPLRGSHGRVNLLRFKSKLVETLKDCGTLEHQLFLLHKVLTEGELAGIGLGLGLLQNPDV